MSAKRKKDLRQKLKAAPAPAPPAGLAERIKSEIPGDLRVNAELERKRFARSIGSSLGVAASVLILMLSAYAALHMLTRANEMNPAVPPRPAAAAERQTPARTAAQAAESRPEASSSAAAARSEKVEHARPQSVVAEKKQKENEEGVAVSSAGTLQPAPAAQAAAPPANAVASRAAPAAPAAESNVAAAGLAQRDRLTAKVAADERAAAPLQVGHELTVAPNGRTILRVSLTNAPADASVEVEGAKSIAPSLYEVGGEVATIRVSYRQEGGQKTLEQTVRRADARPWSEASKGMKDAVLRSESGKGPPP